LLASIIIKKTKPGLFDILHTRDFNPNSKDFVVYKEKLSANALGRSLMELCDFYYCLLSDGNILSHQDTDAEIENHIETVELYQCKNCLSIYDKSYGDQFNNVPVGTEFKNIENYICPVCESTADCFMAIEKQAHAV